MEEDNINSAANVDENNPQPKWLEEPRRKKRVYGMRDESKKIREPEADPDQANLIKKIQINFDELYVAAVANRIYVYESEHLKPIDVSFALPLLADFLIPLVDIVRSQGNREGTRCRPNAQKHRIIQPKCHERRNYFHGTLSCRL